MGLFRKLFGGGGSSSSSSSTTQTTQVDNSVVAGSGAITATGGSTINYLDKDVAMGAMDVATELGKRSLSLSGEAISGALDFADTASRRSNEFADTANRRSYEFADDANRRSYDFAQSNQEATIKILDRNADVTEATRVGNANLARDLSNTLASKLEKNTQSADVTLIQTVGKYAAVIAGIVAVAVFLSRRNTAR
jgi:hypothetical protein